MHTVHEQEDINWVTIGSEREQEAGFIRGLRNNPACTYEIRPRPNQRQSCQELASRDLPVPIRESADVGASHWMALDAPRSRPRFIGLQQTEAEQLPFHLRLRAAIPHHGQRNSTA